MTRLSIWGEFYMRKEVIDSIGGVLFIIFGLYSSIRYKSLAQKTCDFWFKDWNMPFGVKGYQIGFLLVGIFFAISGLRLLLSTVIPF